MLVLQHLKVLGPGHWFETVVPSQSDVQRQLPDDPLVHEGFEQHLMSSGSLGQALEMVTPPEVVQLAVETQTPGLC